MVETGATSRVTLRTLRQWTQAGQRFAMLTCYDATTATWLWRGGVRCLLVGDTAAQVMLGHDSTLPAKMSFMLAITAAVRRGAPESFLMADMPFGSYQCGDDRAIRNAVRFLTDGVADAVKLEVGASSGSLVARMSQAGIPVVAHIGSRPQHVRAKGGYGAVGRSIAEAKELVETARMMVSHGAAMLLVEAVPAQVSAAIVEAVASAADRRIVPVIGCGAGAPCHGHVVVLHDLLGLTQWQPPFAKPMADFGTKLSDVASKWVELVRSGRYLQDDHPYTMDDQE